MSTTLSGSYNTAFNLTISFQSPVTVARTGYFSVASDAAIYGHPGHYWSVLNLGRIYSTDTFSGAGIQLNSSGSVTNGQSGPGEDTAQIRGGLIGVLIDGDTAAVTNFGRIGAGPLTSDTSVYGVQLLGTTVSTVTNGDHGLIYGSSIGVLTQSGPATIVNSGRLAAPEFSGSAVKLTGAGNDSVSNSGAIYGGDGIEIDKGSATITNTGSIFGTGTSSGNGVVLDAGGALYNGLKPFETGYILGRYAGVAASDAPATVVNLDRITGKSAASLGVELSDGGSLVNGSSNDTGASIVGGVGARLGSAGSVTNFGTIKGTSAYVGDGIRLDGFVSNRTVDNASSAALISGTRYGVLSLNPTTLTNYGTIEGAIGIDLSGALEPVSSTVTNAGTITGSSGTALSFGAADDRLIVDPGSVFVGIVSADGGIDEIDFTAAGTVGLGPTYVGFEIVRLGNGGADSLTLTNADFTAAVGSTVTIVGGNDGNTVDASALTGANRVVVSGGAGTDVLKGGAGNDEFRFTAGHLATTDRVSGGGGVDELFMTTAGVVDAAGLSGVEIFRLGHGAADTLSLTKANFAGVTRASITIEGGDAGNTVTAAGVGGPDRIVAVGGAGRDVFTGGAGNDVFEFAAADLGAKDLVKGGGGSDELLMTSAGTIRAAGVTQVESYRLATGGADVLTLAKGNFSGVVGNTITVTGGASGNTVNASGLGAADKVVLIGGAGADSFIGGAGDDIFRFAAASLTSADTVQGNAGDDRLILTTAGAIGVNGLSGIETIRLASAGPDSIVLGDANFTGVSGSHITVLGGDAGNTVNAAAVTGQNRLTMVGGAGADAFTGGAGDDILEFTAAHLTAADTVQGRGGADRLLMTSAGTVTVSGVSGVETYRLADGGANRLNLQNANFTGVAERLITVIGGNGGDTIGEAGVSGADTTVLKGDAGADKLTAGRNATMTGGAGADLFVLTTPGSPAAPDTNRITDFDPSADRLAFSDAGFNLGVDEGKGSAVPRPIAAALLSTRTDGGFAGANNRFAYDRSTGKLYYDANGSSAGHANQLVATLTTRPILGVGDLFFLS